MQRSWSKTVRAQRRVASDGTSVARKVTLKEYTVNVRDAINETMHPVERWQGVRQVDMPATKATKRSLSATRQQTGHGKPMLRRVSGGFAAAALGSENLARDVSRFDPAYQISRLMHKAKEIQREMARIVNGADTPEAWSRFDGKLAKLQTIRTQIELIRLKA